jgi:glycosyltransferase involved in cell wall biosynthesis
MEDKLIHSKVSIITINLNDADGLDKTICSIESQTYSNFELLIIDGGSEQASIDVINKHNDSIDYWISESDTGIYNAQNKGIQVATGEYCLFLNSGDYLADKTVLQRIFSQEPYCDVVFGNLVVIFGGKVVGVSKGKDKLTFLDVYSSLIKHQASFIKRELFDKFGLYDETLKIVSDWAFLFKIIGYNSATTQYFDVDIACFENNGISNNNPELCATERQKVLDQFMPKLMQEDYLILQRSLNLRYINENRVGWFLYRILGKCCKVFSSI